MLQVAYNMYIPAYKDLKIHERHLKFSAIEVGNIERKLNPSLMQKASTKKNIRLSLKREVFLWVPDTNIQKCGLHSLKFRGSVLWNNLPANLKEYHLSLEFKLILKQSGSLTCFSLVCRSWIVFGARFISMTYLFEGLTAY